MIIHVTGYPRSGTTWLSRLLADVYNCPLGGSVPQEDTKEPAAFGWERDDSIIVRKGHYMPVSRPETAVAKPHQLNINSQDWRKVVHIIRHPFDVAVSASVYHSISVKAALERMATGTAYNLPAWQDYEAIWHGQPVKTSFITYETLLECPQTRFEPFTGLLSQLELPYRRMAVKEAFDNREFLSQVRMDLEGSSDATRRILDEGVAGRWRERMSKQERAYGAFYFGEIMEAYGYES